MVTNFLVFHGFTISCSDIVPGEGFKEVSALRHRDAEKEFDEQFKVFSDINSDKHKKKKKNQKLVDLFEEFVNQGLNAITSGSKTSEAGKKDFSSLCN